MLPHEIMNKVKDLAALAFAEGELASERSRSVHQYRARVDLLEEIRVGLSAPCGLSLTTYEPISGPPTFHVFITFPSDWMGGEDLSWALLLSTSYGLQASVFASRLSAKTGWAIREQTHKESEQGPIPHSSRTPGVDHHVFG